MRLPASNQIWLTCENPAILVQKYGKYLHGDSTKTCRVRLSEVLALGNSRVVSRDDLLYANKQSKLSA
ncbi:uncharacterized protein N7518_010095 [Penicillium psychrosexuale]|uniref:uncharacterized protein n=1 Tax=Penicillium psychrosexuale TaxID=1002107 RepID=UPI002544E45A|nr:uncharacterized protein N7518_010095 [Penicillium psychrosexuale]KAJ5781612.1 hypothetical protein N7518_010095 [Penicillium psychrosexuale]